MTTMMHDIFSFCHVNLLRKTVQYSPGEVYLRTLDPGRVVQRVV